MATKQLEHDGRIVSIDGDRAVIEIVVNGGCASCSAKSKCGMSESAKREISLSLPKGLNYECGQMVRVGVSYRDGYLAVLYAYILPLVVLVSILIGALAIGLSEGVAAVGSIVGAGIYYIILYLLRDRVEEKILFTIKR
ncbi:MAG: SoxR reducing system RseC family protein [Rikenellaceae bacterium]